MEKILEVTNLITSFHTKDGTYPAVNGVGFTLSRGETLAIVGESGCGKSVTSLSIMKLLPAGISEISPESSIRFKGEEISGYTNKQMSKLRGNNISMVFQDSLTSLNPTMTIEKQMREPFMVHQGMKKREANEHVVEMLRKVGIPNPEVRAKQYPHELSGGMRQRVIIAMALSCNPEVLICDEPTTALDVTIQAQIMKMINELKRDLNTGVILITHDMGVVAEMADRVMVMYGGVAVEENGDYAPFNLSKIKDTAYMDLELQLQSAVTDEEIQQVISEIQKLVLTEYNYIWLYSPNMNVAVSEKVQGINKTMMLARSFDYENWYVTA